MVIANPRAQKDFPAAKTLATSWPEPSDRMQAYSTIALALAKAEQLAQHPVFRGLPDQSFIALSLATVFARTGQPDHARDDLQKAGTRASDHDIDRIIIAALADQDFAAANPGLDMRQPPALRLAERGRAVQAVELTNALGIATVTA